MPRPHEKFVPALSAPQVWKIRIVKTPPGFAPLDVRRAWVNLELPLVSDEELCADPPSGGFGNENGGGYYVLRVMAIAALMTNGKRVAAQFWMSLSLGKYLVFKRECCKLIP